MAKQPRHASTRRRLLATFKVMPVEALANMMARSLLHLGEGLSPWWMLLVVIMLMSILTEMLSNHAMAVLMPSSGRCNLPQNCHFCFQRGISATICRIYSVLPPCYVGFPFLLIQD